MSDKKYYSVYSSYGNCWADFSSEIYDEEYKNELINENKYVLLPVLSHVKSDDGTVGNVHNNNKYIKIPAEAIKMMEVIDLEEDSN